MLNLIKARIDRLEEICTTLEIDGDHYPTKGDDGGDDCL